MTRHTIRRRPAAGRMTGFVLIALLLGGATAGCSSDVPGKSPDAAVELQSQVLAVTESAAVDDRTSTLKLLDELVTKLDKAAMDGDITFQRHRSILDAINALRTELTAKTSASPAVPEPATTPPAALEPAVPEPGATPVAEPAAAPVNAPEPVAVPLVTGPAPSEAAAAPAAPIEAAAAVGPSSEQPPARTDRGKGSGNSDSRGSGNGRGNSGRGSEKG